MRANTTYHMRARIDGQGQTWYDTDQVFTTGSMPNVTYPHPVVLQPHPAGEGVDLVSDLNANKGIGAVVVDGDGSIIWYYYDPNVPDLSFPIRQLPNGHFLVQDYGYVREVDLEGNVIRELTHKELNDGLTAAGYDFQVEGFHHDMLRLDNGHLVVLVHEFKEFCNLPGSPGCTNVEADDVIDVDQNNAVKWVWRAFDHLDINRHPYQWPDWTHCNALVYLPDGNLLLSSRHQRWVMKLEYLNGVGSGDVLWRLGPEGDFTLTPNDPTEWFYNQHYPNVLDINGSKMTLAVFDNGNQRPTGDNGESCDHTHDVTKSCYSRGVILDLDESNLTANITWQDKLPYSLWGGSIVMLPNGNLEIDSSTVQGGHSRVVEVTHESHPRQVWRMESDDARFYRAYRIPSLYPGVQW